MSALATTRIQYSSGLVWSLDSPLPFSKQLKDWVVDVRLNHEFLISQGEMTP